MVKRPLKRKLLVDELLLLDYVLGDHSDSACSVSEVMIRLRQVMSGVWKPKRYKKRKNRLYLLDDLLHHNRRLYRKYLK
jgi:hypothetical protein